jgi:uncharacterized membrane protein
VLTTEEWKQRALTAESRIKVLEELLIDVLTGKIKYHTPKKVLEIYEATEEENNAAIRELDKQLIQLKKELERKGDES